MCVPNEVIQNYAVYQKEGLVIVEQSDDSVVLRFKRYNSLLYCALDMISTVKLFFTIEIDDANSQSIRY